MGEYICFLITILYREPDGNDSLLKSALKVKKEQLQGDCIEYPMEPENKKQLHSLLPLHVKNSGPIVDIDEIFEITDITD